jgi:aspartoacylase
VLVVAGTHGNEVNAPWMMAAWRRQPDLLRASGLDLDLVIGNPSAHRSCRRYLDCDLNRSFDPELLGDPRREEREVLRARELLRHHGPEGERPCLVAIDLHSTTAAMGNCLVVYGRRPADLALAAGLQAALGLPIYLHEEDPGQTGYLVERWPCGLVVEVGPVPQGVLSAPIGRQSQLALESALAVLASARSGGLQLPCDLVVHRHLGSIDLPRLADGTPAAIVHPRRQHRDWQPIRPGDPLFQAADGRTISYEPPEQVGGDPVWTVFINEAAYGEKGIALSVTRREIWPVPPEWGARLGELAGGLLQRGDPL